MPRLAAPGLKAIDVGADRRVENAGGADDDVGFDDLGGSVDNPSVPVRTRRRGRTVVAPAQACFVRRGAQAQTARLPAPLVVRDMAHFGAPDLALGVIADALNRGVETNVAAHIEVVGNFLQVAVQLFAQTEVHLPVVRSERIRIEVIRCVHAGARISVLPPDATDGAVALDHLVGHTGLLEVDRGAQPRCARTDHQHLEAGRHVDGVVAQELGEAELGRSECAVLVGYVLSHCRAQHPHNQGIVGLGDRHRAAVAPRGHRLERRFAHFLLVFGRQAAAVVVTETGLPLGEVRGLEPMQLARHLHQHHQQRRDVRNSHCRREGLVVHIRSASGRRRAVVGGMGPVLRTVLGYLWHRSPSAV